MGVLMVKPFLQDPDPKSSPSIWILKLLLVPDINRLGLTLRRRMACGSVLVADTIKGEAGKQGSRADKGRRQATIVSLMLSVLP